MLYQLSYARMLRGRNLGAFAGVVKTPPAASSEAECHQGEQGRGDGQGGRAPVYSTTTAAGHRRLRGGATVGCPTTAAVRCASATAVR